VRFQYLILGKQLAEMGVSDFWPDNGHLMELREGALNPDQWSFKGKIMLAPLDKGSATNTTVHRN
jgi:hypothetical protein